LSNDSVFHSRRVRRGYIQSSYVLLVRTNLIAFPLFSITLFTKHSDLAIVEYIFYVKVSPVISFNILLTSKDRSIN
jgi:hypothetical protein